MSTVAVAVQLTGHNGNTAKNQALVGGDEHIVTVACPVITGVGGEFQFINTGTTTLVVNRAATTASGTVGIPVPAGGSMLIEANLGRVFYVYGASAGSYAILEQ
jgi:hypothetical protein